MALLNATGRAPGPLVPLGAKAKASLPGIGRLVRQGYDELAGLAKGNKADEGFGKPTELDVTT
jgi:hypothetical protein